MSETNWHNLIIRQLRRSGLAPPDELPAELQKFLRTVNNSYTGGDETRERLEHSLGLSSKEMGQLYVKLEAHNDRLEEEVRKRAVDLIQANERFRSLCDSSPIGIFNVDKSDQVVYINHRFEEIFERTKEDLIGKGWIRFIIPEDIDLFSNDPFIAASKNGTIFRQYRILTPSTKIKWLHTSPSSDHCEWYYDRSCRYPRRFY